jgi:hypothetical protein
MSFVYQAGVFTSYAINLGLADKQLQNQLLSTQAGTAASLNKLNRTIVSNTISPSGNTDANYDATLVLTQGLRSTEDTLVSNLDLFYTNTLYSTDTYFQSVVGFSFRDYFDSKTTDRTLDYTGVSYVNSAIGLSNFRDLYRRVYGQELIYRVYDFNTSGNLVSTGATYDFPGSLLEFRKYFSTGTAGTISFNLTRTDGGTDTVSIGIGAFAGTAGSYVNLETSSGSITRYSAVQAVTISGLNTGTGRTFEIWTR